MQRCICLTLFAFSAFGQHDHDASAGNPAQMLAGLGRHHHAIATTNPEGQRYFDQGLTLIYAFNHEEAIKSFEKAAELDPAAVMPQWGIAYSLGPNINLDVDPAREKAAFDAVRKAQALAARAPAVERDYVTALATRYSDNPQADLKKLGSDFANAMGALSRKYPDDLDAATLYAESMMDLRPWRLWTPDGKPEEGTLDIVAVLESVLRRDPNHVGANHYYIHTVEASTTPERALASAKRLETLTPAAGHLVHMPAHIYTQLGDLDGVIRSNEAAAAADREYMKLSGNNSGVYPLMYYNHNIHFLVAGNALMGRYNEARASADELSANVSGALDQMPMLQPFAAMKWFLMLRFQRWDEFLQVPEPDPKYPLLQAIWHFGKGTALAGKGQVAQARQELQQLEAAIAQVPADVPWIDNPAAGVLKVAVAELSARIAEASGDRAAAVELWKKTVAAQDVAGYSEPPLWYYATRESLGGALLRAGRAAEAEAVFREDLVRNSRSPRSLFGLLESLKAQNKSGVEWVEAQFKEAWAHGDHALRINDL